MVQYQDVLPTFLEIASGKTQKGFDGISFGEVLKGNTQKHRDLVYGIHTKVGVNNGNPNPIRAVSDQCYKLIWNLLHEDEYHNNLTELDRKWFFFLD